MSEHAFDPIPDEQQEPALAVVAEPNATVTYAQLEDALTSGRWTHDVPSTALWLNTSFPPKGETAVTLSGLLGAHGVAIIA